MGFAKCFLYITFSGLAAFLLGLLIPRGWFSAQQWFFRSRTFEKSGALYEKVKIRRWKNLLPDMSRIFPKMLEQKSLKVLELETLHRLIAETCIAEITHIALCISGFHCIALWPGAGGWILSFLSLFGNLLYVIIQRYNRPRLLLLSIRFQKRRQNKSGSQVSNDELRGANDEVRAFSS